MADVERSTQSPAPFGEEYVRALSTFIKAKQELEAKLYKMHQIGNYPSPPSQLRFQLPDERTSTTHKFEIGLGEEGMEGYITCGTFTDGKPGEIFITVAKEGSFTSGILDAFATLFSIALQSGVPLELLISKFKHDKFEPAGLTKNPQIKITSSVIDYLMRWLEVKYIEKAGVENDGRETDVHG